MDASLYQLLQHGATLLTASRHLSHALRQEYAQAAQAQGLMVWSTPRILPWSTYLRTACQQQRDHDAQAPRLLNEQQALALWERIVAESAAGSSLLNPSQAARNAQRGWQRLHQYRIPLQKVAAYPGEEAQAFSGWADSFVTVTQSKGWLDSARFATYLHDSGFVPETELAIYGFDQVTPEMQLLLDVWRARGITLHFPEILPRRGQACVLAAKDSGDELQRAARWSRAQLERGVQRIAVVVPRLTAQVNEVSRRFTGIFSPGQRRIDQETQPPAFQIAATPALSSYPLVHHALLLLQLAQGRANVLLVGQLLRSPFLAGFDDEAMRRALADVHARDDERREYWTCNELERLAATCRCPRLAAGMHAAANYLREHQDNALPSQWTERFSQLLKLGGWAQGRTLNSDEQQVLNKFQQLMATLSALDELLGRISLRTAVNILRDACNAESFAPEAVEQPVTIIDADSIAGMQFDALWVTGLHAGDWPPAPEPDPFLPVELQRQYGVPEASAEHCLQRARHKLSRLIGAADEVVLSWPQHDDDAELRPSPLLTQPSIHVEALPQAVTQTLEQQLFTHRPEPESFTDDVAPPAAAGAVSGGTRVLELQSRCPFRAQAELRLHARPLPSVSPAVEATERGTLVHRVLTEVWQQLKDSEGLRAISLDDYVHTVRSIAERAAQQVIKATTVHRRRLAALEVELCVHWIMMLLELEAQRLPFRVYRAEQSEPYNLAGMNIRIQLDRIDELADGGRLLIDYKTGEANKPFDWLDKTPGRPRSPQLPLYALAHRQQLAGITFAVLAPGKAEFRGLADTDTIAPGITDYAQLRPGSKLPGVESWDDLLQHWQNVLNTLAQQYLSGAAYVDPLKNECMYCHLQSLCRVHELLEGEELESEEEGEDV